MLCGQLSQFNNNIVTRSAVVRWFYLLKVIIENMRLPTVNCILLACIATTMAANEPRPKRDLLYLKNLLTSTLFGSSQDTIPESAPVLIRQDGDVKIFRLPGFDHILVRAVPKDNAKTQAQAAEEIRVIENPTIGSLESYLGTKTQGQTLAALQGIKNLLKSGILNAQRDLLEILPVEEPCGIPPVAVIQERPKMPLIPILPPLVPVSPIQTKYSYKQTGVDGKVTTHSSTNGKNVIVTNEPMPPPPEYILNRLQHVFYSSMKPVSALTRVVLPKPTRPVSVLPVQTIVEAPNVGVKVNPYVYKQHHHSGSMTTYSGSGAVNEQIPIVDKSVSRPPYLVDGIKKVSASALSTNLPKAPSGYGFKIVNNVGTADNLARRVFYNGFYQTPERTTSRYVYKQMYPNGPLTVFGVEDIPKFDTKGEVHVNVNNGHPSANHYAPDFLSTGRFYYNQHHPDGTFTTYSGDKDGRIYIKEIVKTIPTMPVKIVDGIDKVADSGHTAQMPKPSGYSFRIVNNEAYMNNMANNQAGNNVGVENQAASGSGIYSYKQINNDGTSTSYMGTDEGKKGNSVVLLSETNKDIPASFAGQAQSADRPSSGYSFKLVNNQASNYGGTTPVQKHQNIEMASQANSGSFSYKQVNNDGTSTTYLGSDEGKKGNSVVLVSQTNKKMPAAPAFIVNRIEKVAGQIAQDQSAEKASSGYSYTLVNNQASQLGGRAPDQRQQNMGSLHLSAVVDEANEGQLLASPGLYSYKLINNDGTSTNYVNIDEGMRTKTLALEKEINEVKPVPSGYSFKIVNNQASHVGGNIPDQIQQHMGSLHLSSSAAETNQGEKLGSSGSYSYKQINNAGIFTTYLESNEGKKENSVDLVSESSKDMPAPPSFIVDRIEKVAAQAHSPDKASSGYSFKLVNTQASNYGGSTPVQKYQNIGMASEDDSGSFSYKQVNNDGTLTTYLGLDEGKKGNSVVLVSDTKKEILAPPAFIDGIEKETDQSTQTQSVEKASSGYSFKLVNNQATQVSGNTPDQTQQSIGSLHLSEVATEANKVESASDSGSYSTKLLNDDAILTTNVASDSVGSNNAESFSSGAYSYKQVNNGGTSTTYKAIDEGRKGSSAVLVEDTNGAILPPPAFVVNRIEETAANSHAAQKSGYSFKLVNNQAFADNVGGQQTVKKSSANEANNGISSGSGAYSYRQIHNAGTSTYVEKVGEKKENSPDLVTDTNKTKEKSGYAFSLMNNNNKGHNRHSEWKDETSHQPSVLFTAPVPSRYVYKQTNSNYPKPFTVVRVEDNPTFETNSEVTVKVNMHEHINPDGTRYLCDQKHVLPVPHLVKNFETVPDIESGLVYVPPTLTEETKPTEQVEEETDSSLEQGDAYSLSRNPIVVAPEGYIYSYKQSATDGSSISIQGESPDTVSVSVNESENTESHRGDIP